MQLKSELRDALTYGNEIDALEELVELALQLEHHCSRQRKAIAKRDSELDAYKPN